MSRFGNIQITSCLCVVSDFARRAGKWYRLLIIHAILSTTSSLKLRSFMKSCTATLTTRKVDVLNSSPPKSQQVRI
ncbi:uncharacterized protein PHALS_15469 [Plasmopara halstedii]|uniref:Uncharacterized protein n=1 Tax=Plasmopara halstedii TaxID=4781 RepID=A0A0P1AIR7_PLAHL|nr:uncharacterized protein PHALS_15469 [Plasmopara halstedii]CEG40806.1 hypothetical protein PHALS_15469 [Plasmopara halstedii]|eukprot:XP_024577175.1 hypothetical protein PHALS_15469 [Plasmopara halstedii]